MLQQPIWQLILVVLALALAQKAHQWPGLRSLQIPDAMTAGILLAIFYQSLAPWLAKNELKSDHLKPLIGHLLNIFYIAITLKSTNYPKSPNRNKHDVVGTVVFILWHYGLQAFIGLAMAMGLAMVWYPELPAVIGLFVPLGYALGPAQAYEIGNRWQDANNISLGDIGLTFGALGYLWASLGGLVALNLFARNKNRPTIYLKLPQSKLNNHPITGQTIPSIPIGITSNPLLQAMIHILICYGLGLLFLDMIEVMLIMVRNIFGLDGLDLIDTLRSISFVFCSVAALAFSQLLRFIRYLRGIQIEPNLLANRETALNHLADIFVRVMVCVGIGSISLDLIRNYINIILIVGIISAVILTPLHFLLAKYYFYNERLERALVIYGGMMGTTSTGMALLGTLDPYYNSQAAQDYLMATGFAFLGLLPVIVSLQWIHAGYYNRALALYGFYAILTSALILWRIYKKSK